MYIYILYIIYLIFLRTHRLSGDQMGSTIVIKINFVDEFYFHSLCFVAESI